MIVTKQASTLGKRLKQEGCKSLCSRAGEKRQKEKKMTKITLYKGEEDQDIWVEVWSYNVSEWERWFGA